VINFQKSKFGTKEEFDLTINVGVYINGTQEMIFGKEPDFILEPYCFFRKRPRFFGAEHDWWKFDGNHVQQKLAEEIESFLRDKVLPYLSDNMNIENLVSDLPIEKWSKNKGLHNELLLVAVAYLILGYKDISRNMLRTISVDKNAWGDKASRILKAIDKTNI
jgi:hypothetical protein